MVHILQICEFTWFKIRAVQKWSLPAEVDLGQQKYWYNFHEAVMPCYFKCKKVPNFIFIFFIIWACYILTKQWSLLAPQGKKFGHDLDHRVQIIIKISSVTNHFHWLHWCAWQSGRQIEKMYSNNFVTDFSFNLLWLKLRKTFICTFNKYLINLLWNSITVCYWVYLNLVQVHLNEKARAH